MVNVPAEVPTLEVTATDVGVGRSGLEEINPLPFFRNEDQLFSVTVKDTTGYIAMY